MVLPDSWPVRVAPWPPPLGSVKVRVTAPLALTVPLRVSVTGPLPVWLVALPVKLPEADSVLTTTWRDETRPTWLPAVTVVEPLKVPTRLGTVDELEPPGVVATSELTVVMPV